MSSSPVPIDAVRLLRDGVKVAYGAEAIAEAARQLVAGEVVAIPTDTVYGLAAAIDSPPALAGIFAIKRRDRARTLPVLVPDRAAAELLLRLDRTPSAPEARRLLALAGHFWPGGLTVALPARIGMPAQVVARDGTIGVRVPDSDVAQALIRLAGGGLAVTSANRSGQPPLLDADAVHRDLGGDAGLRWVLDGGPAGLAVASTVVGLRGNDLVIHRQGVISSDALRRRWAEISSPTDQPPG